MQTTAETNKKFATQLPRNFIANIAFFSINIIIGILIVPYFISTLGVAAYGIVPLATSITGYVIILVQSLNSAVSRYLTIDLQQNNYKSANRTFNTAVFGLSVLIALMIPVATFIAYNIPGFFDVPTGMENDVYILFLCVFTAVLINSWCGNYTVQLFANNRIDLQNIVSITSIIVQTGLIVILFNLYNPSLVFIGIAYVTAAVISSSLSIILAKNICPQLKLSVGSVDIGMLKTLVSMSWWVIVNQIGYLLFLQIDLIVVNLLFGAGSAGQYAVVLTWAALLRGMASMISGVLTPMVFTYYAKGQTDAIIKMMISAVKIMGLFMALPIGLICGFAPQILTFWVGEKFTTIAPLMVVMILHLTINLAVIPLFSINVAYNKIKVPGIVTLIMGAGNFALAISLPLLTSWGFYGVAAAGAIVLTLKNAVFTPWYATKVMGIKKMTFVYSMIPGIIAACILIVMSTIIGVIIQISSIIALITIGGIIGLLYITMVWRFGLSEFERKLFESYIPQKMKGWVI